MGKFGALFDDSDDESHVAQVPPPVVPLKPGEKPPVPQPPVPIAVPQPPKVATAVPVPPVPVSPKAEEAASEAPARPTRMVDSSDDEDEPAVPKEPDTVAESPPAVQAPEPAASAVPVAAAPPVAQPAFAASMPVFPASYEAPAVAPSAAVPPAIPPQFVVSAKVDEQVSELQGQLVATQGQLTATHETVSGLHTEVHDSFAAVLQQLAVLAEPPPAPLPVSVEACPPLNGFPEYAAKEAPSQKDGFEEREKYWDGERSKAAGEAATMLLKERERDSNVVLQHSTDQIAQLRQEKDELRKAYDEQRTQLASHESTLKEQTAREGEDMAQFKRQFNDILKQQAQETEKLTKELHAEQGVVAELKAALASTNATSEQRAVALQEKDLVLAALRVEKHDADTNQALTSVQLSATKSEVAELRQQLDRMSAEKATMAERMETLMKAKYDYMSVFATQHNEHVSSLQQKYEEREQFLAKEYATREAGLRAALLKFSENLQKAAEDQFGGQKKTYFKLEQQMKTQHEVELARAEKDRKDLEAKLRKEMKALSDEKESELKEVRQELEKDIAKLKQDKERTLQAAHMEAKSKLAEMEKQHRIKNTNMEKKAAEDKEQLTVMFSRELTKIGDEHRKAERDLEKHHRDRESELEKHIKYMKIEVQGAPASSAQTTASSAGSTQGGDVADEFMDKWDKRRQNMRERHEIAKKSLQ